MKIDWTFVVEVIKALAWPAFAGFALFVLRRPLIELLAYIGRRATKVSVFKVSFELAALSELQPQWTVSVGDTRRLTSADIFDSYTQTLFDELRKPAGAEYVIVDLAKGEAWLTSRLFIFALVLGEVTGIRAFVFLENVNGQRRRFLGAATPANVRRALGSRYPWFEEAYARALLDASGYVHPPPAPGESSLSNTPSAFASGNQFAVNNFVRRFVEWIQRQSAPPPDHKSSYLAISSKRGSWERAHWIDGERLEQDLAGVLEMAWTVDSPDTPRNLVSEAVVRRDASFVALVDGDRRFLGLVDRNALLSQMAIARNGVPKNPDERRA